MIRVNKENIINIKSNLKHSTLEYFIRKFDPSQDMSRSAIFERAVKAAENVTNWREIAFLLSDFQYEKEAPIFTNFQARYNEETAKILINVKNKMRHDLNKIGIKKLQKQYIVLLLQANYLKILKEERLSIITSEHITKEDLDIPGMAKIFCEIILLDKDCNELNEIKNILINWKNKI